MTHTPDFNAPTFNKLPAAVWPRTAMRDGDVSIAGVSLPSIAKEYGTPVMVVDEIDFRSRCRDMARAFGGPEHVHYASKAFMTSRIVQWVNEEGLSLDIASHGELLVALHAGFPAERIAAHGNNKDAAFLRDCVSKGVGFVILDSHQEIEDLHAIATELGRTQDVLIRVKPGIDAHTHEFISTAHEDQKFGFSLAAERILKLYRTIIEECEVGEEFNILNLGGGYGIAYVEGEQPLDVEAVSTDLLQRVNTYAERLHLTMPFIKVEPGRAIAGPSTVTVYTVGTVKDVTIDGGKTRRYISVDGGMGDNIRPALYGAEYDIRLVNRSTDAPLIPTRVVGSHCESGDILINDRNLPEDIRPGDIVALAATGAYCYSMSSRYNMMMRPAIVSVGAADDKAHLMVRRETLEDFFNLEA